jgi:signal transduction histidine kinase
VREGPGTPAAPGRSLPRPLAPPPQGLPPLPAEEALLAVRLRQFVHAMLPIAGAFAALYGASAALLDSVALWGGTAAVLLYAAALVVARRWVAAGRFPAAARLTGAALLAMVGVGAVFLHFLAPALLLIPLAAVAVVLPHLERRPLGAFLLAALGVEAWVLAWMVPGPRFPQPPPLFQDAVLVSAALAAAALTVRLQWVDALRLRGALQAAREAARLREEFLSVASHELKTPLTTLSLRLQALEREAAAAGATPLAGRVLQHVASGRRQAERLHALVAELLDVSRVDAGRLPLLLERVDLAALSREVVGHFEPQAERAGTPLRLEVQLPSPDAAVGRWDPLRLEQVLGNLLSNALKYGAGAPVLVRVGAEGGAAAGRGVVRLEVVDAGIGIAPEVLPRIFEKFERGVSDRHYGGLGLGLYLARHLVEAHGGRIRAGAGPGGRGARFTVELPREGPPVG